MRNCLLAIALVVAGCAGPAADGPTAPGGSEPTPEPTPEPAGGTSRLPADIEEEIAYFGAFEATGAAVGAACTFQPWCFDYDFRVRAAGAHMEARLAWSLAANDLDLLLLHEDAVIQRAERRGDAGPETLELDLEPGDYVLRVVPYFVPDEPDARLTATFSPTDSS